MTESHTLQRHVTPPGLQQWDSVLGRFATAGGVGGGAVVLGLAARLLGFSFSQKEI